MTEQAESAGHLPSWVGTWASIIGPITVLSALLFYFGYVSARAQYEYFGIDVDTVGLGTQDYIMRSPQPLLTPLLTIVLLGAGTVTAHLAIRRRITAARTAALPRPLARIDSLVRLSRIIGLILLGAGIVLLFAYPLLGRSAGYAMATPLLLATGAGLIAYLRRLHGLLPATPQQPIGDTVVLHRMATVLLYALVVVSVFWATATVAQWSGRGQAYSQARDLETLPRVILDTKERLYLRSPGIEETSLPTAKDQTFRYRYRRLRLLIIGRERMFLVPDKWSASDSTLVVPLNDSIRVQFQFQNSPP